MSRTTGVGKCRETEVEQKQACLLAGVVPGGTTGMGKRCYPDGENGLPEWGNGLTGLGQRTYRRGEEEGRKRNNYIRVVSILGPP